MRSILFIIPLSILLLACNRTTNKESGQQIPYPDTANDSVHIAGAYALAPFIQTCADSFRLNDPAATIHVIPAGHDFAIHALEDDRIDLAMISRKLGQKEEQDYFALAVAKTGIVLIFNTMNPCKDQILMHGMTISDLQVAFSGKNTIFWDNLIKRGKTMPVNIYIRKDQSGAAEVLADFLFMETTEFNGTAVNGENEMIAAIQKDSMGLGFCNINDAFDLSTRDRKESLEFLPLDLNMNGSIEEREKICSNLDEFQNSICHNTYPYKLSRNLYLVAKNKPSDALTLAFLDYILSEGQRFIIPMGYSEISGSLIKYNRYLLK